MAFPPMGGGAPPMGPPPQGPAPFSGMADQLRNQSRLDPVQGGSETPMTMLLRRMRAVQGPPVKPPMASPAMRGMRVAKAKGLGLSAALKPKIGPKAKAPTAAPMGKIGGGFKRF